MIKAGDYVRVMTSAKDIFGTIEGSKHENGGVMYLVRPDPRMGSQIQEFYVALGMFELCRRPDEIKGEKLK
jgi:hypothetical protein